VARSFTSLLAALVIMPGVGLTLDALTRGAATAQSSRDPLTGDKPAVRPAPEWRNTSWLNTTDGKPLSLTALRGRVVLLNFWTFTCWNCTGALPSLVAFDRAYRAQGLTVIGIHSPEFPPYAGEHDRENVRQALIKHHIEYPNAQDNDHATWNLYDIQYWPSYVLIDRRGYIRHEGYGEFHVGDRWHAEWEHRIQRLLAER
jgi:thiol-disulfide isomerase/thioredoxin